MATVTATPTAGSLTVSGNTQVSGTISWSKPSIPTGATISSCVLTGTATANMSNGSATIKVNGTTVTSGSKFTINLGTSNNTTSVTTTAKGGNKKAKGTVSFSNLVYTVTYTLPAVTYTVTFKDWDGTVLKTEKVTDGDSATPPSNPIREGYTFDVWDKSFNNITADTVITAHYIDSTNLMPPFTDGVWYLPTDCISENQVTYTCSFSTENAWTGIMREIPTDWWGKAIRVSCESITSNANFYIQGVKADAATGTESFTDLLVLNSDTTSIDYKFPEAGTYDRAVMVLQSPNVSPGIITITNLRAEYVEISSDETNLFPPFTDTAWYVTQGSDFVREMYNCSFTPAAVWHGIRIESIPETWYGKTIKIGFESISTGASLFVQGSNADQSLITDLVEVNATHNHMEVTLPNDKTSYANIIMILVNKQDASPVQVTGAYAEVVENSGGSGGTEEENDPGIYTVQLGDRTVGANLDISSESPLTDAVIVNNATELLAKINTLQPGQTMYLREGVYTLNAVCYANIAGTETQPITIKNYPGERPTIIKNGFAFVSPSKYVTLEGIKFKDMTLEWGFALKIDGGVTHFTLNKLIFTNIKCTVDAEGNKSGCNPIVIYGDNNTGGNINNVTVENCYIFNCDTGWSESITLNGNTSECIVRNNTINNNGNIGIDLAGNFQWTGTVGDPTNQSRNNIVENNLVMNCQSPIATSAGIYCDGGRDNEFRYNVIYGCQCGFEMGAEEPGSTVENFHIHNNLIINCGRAIGIGGYLETSATHQNSYIYNNTIICDDSNRENYGLYVERSANVNFVNNIVVGTENTTLFSNNYNSEVNLSNNCWYKPNGSKPAGDTTGLFTNPLFKNNTGTLDGEYRVLSYSPCIDAGMNNQQYTSLVDITNRQRTVNTTDIGAFERQEDDPIDGPRINKLKLGDKEIKGFRIGDKEVTKICLGDIVVYEK